MEKNVEKGLTFVRSWNIIKDVSKRRHKLNTIKYTIGAFSSVGRAVDS